MNKVQLEAALNNYNAGAGTFESFQEAMLCSDKKGRSDVYKRIKPERWTPHVLELCRRIMTSVNRVKAEGDFDELFDVPLWKETLPLWLYMAEYECGYIYRIVENWNRTYKNHTQAEVAIRDQIIEFIQTKLKWRICHKSIFRHENLQFLNAAQLAIEERHEKSSKAANTRSRRQFDFQRRAARDKRRKASAAKKAAERAFSFLTCDTVK